MSINLKKEQTSLNKKFEVIFNNAALINALKTANFQSIIQKELNILIFLEKKNGSKTLKSSVWINAYNNATGVTFQANEQLNYSDSESLVDDINHLTVYVKNIYKLDLDAAIEGRASAVESQSVTEVSEQTNAPKSLADMLPAMFGNNSQFANLPPEQNPIYLQSAQMRIKSEVSSGKLYVYNSKPRIIPILKWFVVSGFILTGIAALVLAVGLFICSQKDKFTGGTPNSMIIDGVLVILFALMCFYLAVMLLIPLIKNFSKKANDNQLYFLDWRLLMSGIFVFAVVIIMLAVDSTLTILGFNSPIAKPDQNWRWVPFIGAILLMSFAIITAGLSALTAHFNPKQDVARLQAIVSAYIAEIVAGSKTTPPSSPLN